MSESRVPIPATPKGWYTIGRAADLEPGQVRSLTYFEQRLALFRGEGGEAHLLDAWCPHQGANIGRGQVNGEALACPYHGWRFGGHGGCVHVPGTDRITKNMRVRAWPLIERNGMLMAWYEPDGGEPEWEIPDLGVVGEPGWSPLEVREHTVKSHVIEIGENQVDFAHWPYVHKTDGFPKDVGVTAEGPLLKVRTRVGMGPPGMEIMTDVRIDSYGLGFGVLCFRSIVEVTAMVLTTPTENDFTHVRMCVTVRNPNGGEVDPTMRAMVQQYFFDQLEQDLEILSDKVYRERPILSAADGPIAKYRAWTEQFIPSR